MDNPLVSIVILTWNSEDFLANCINSVLKQTYSNIELIVMDNNSHDNTIQIMKNSYPQIKRIENGENLGFAKAHNKGIRMSKGEYYMPLNPDVVLTECFVEEMVKTIELKEDIGSVSGKLFFMKENGQRTNLIYTTGHLMTKSRSPTNRGYKTIDIGQYNKIEPVFAANGAAPLYRKKTLEDVALQESYFYKDFFIYGDDHDLGWRAQLCGWKCLYTPYATGYHVGFGSRGIQSFFVQVQFTRNRYLTLVRNDDAKTFFIDLPYILMYELIWQCSRIILSPKRLFAHWLGIIKIIKAFPKTYQTRKEIQKRQIVSEQYIRSFFVSQLW